MPGPLALLPLQLPTNVQPRRHRVTLKYMDTCRLCGRHAWSFWFLTWASPNVGTCGHLRSVPTDGIILGVYVCTHACTGLCSCLFNMNEWQIPKQCFNKDGHHQANVMIGKVIWKKNRKEMNDWKYTMILSFYSIERPIIRLYTSMSVVMHAFCICSCIVYMHISTKAYVCDY